MKAPLINDTLYTSSEIENVREYLIDLRNQALEQTKFDHAVQLSIVVALIAALRDEVAHSEPKAETTA